mmetsp:Transcript_47513/g.151630  ORF Transcript_47513/g.151630 Transcript_47513/m.151630 type:complete len:225 (+) Transcript_47513:759-1433(+)
MPHGLERLWRHRRKHARVGEGHAGHHHAAHEDARLVGLEHHLHRIRQCAGAGGQPHRQGRGGLQVHNDQLQPRALRAHGADGPLRAHLPRGGRRVRPAAQDLRPAPHRPPGHPPQDRGDGPPHRGHAQGLGELRLPGEVRRSGPAAGGLHGVGQGRRLQAHGVLRPRGQPDLRRPELHEGRRRRPRRADLPRGARHGHRRRQRGGHDQPGHEPVETLSGWPEPL